MNRDIIKSYYYQFKTCSRGLFYKRLVKNVLIILVFIIVSNIISVSLQDKLIINTNNQNNYVKEVVESSKKLNVQIISYNYNSNMYKLNHNSIFSDLQLAKKTPKLKSINIEEKEIKIIEGEKVKVNVKIEPSGAQAKLKFSTKNKKIVKVDSKGYITGIKEGKTTITVRSGFKKDSVIVYVNKMDELTSKLVYFSNKNDISYDQAKYIKSVLDKVNISLFSVNEFTDVSIDSTFKTYQFKYLGNYVDVFYDENGVIDSIILESIVILEDGTLDFVTLYSTTQSPLDASDYIVLPTDKPYLVDIAKMKITDELGSSNKYKFPSVFKSDEWMFGKDKDIFTVSSYFEKTNYLGITETIFFDIKLKYEFTDGKFSYDIIDLKYN